MSVTCYWMEFFRCQCFAVCLSPWDLFDGGGLLTCLLRLSAALTRWRWQCYLRFFFFPRLIRTGQRNAMISDGHYAFRRILVGVWMGESQHKPTEIAIFWSTQELRWQGIFIFTRLPLPIRHLRLEEFWVLSSYQTDNFLLDLRSCVRDHHLRFASRLFAGSICRWSNDW